MTDADATDISTRLLAIEQTMLTQNNAIISLTAAVQTLCTLLQAETDPDPEELPPLDLDGGPGGLPRPSGQDLG